MSKARDYLEVKTKDKQSNIELKYDIEKLKYKRSVK